MSTYAQDQVRETHGGSISAAARRYEVMYRIRCVEEALLALFAEGKLFGTTHGSIGQEANAAGVMEHLHPRDVVFSNHRCHGHYLARTGDVRGLVAELMGRVDGVVGGRGGSQHICAENFYTNGIQGGIVPVCAGMALAEKTRGTGAIAAVFIGDGTLGEGAVYETLNMASLWRLPLLVVLENNRYAQSTAVEHNLGGSMPERFEAFGVPAREVETFDVERVAEATGPVVDEIRRGGGPQALILHTYRFCSHSKSPDGRDESEVARWREGNDPLDIQRPRVDDGEVRRIQADVEAEVAEAIAFAEASPYPRLSVEARR